MPAPQSIKKVVDRIKCKTLVINEIFYSIQGESTRTGLPTAFIRLTGCPLRCRYCDTAYAFHEGGKMTIGDILHAIAGYRTRYVTVTGGALDISAVDERVCRILDIKTPGSGEAGKNRYANLSHLTPADQIKFVICDRDDYEWARGKLRALQLNERCEVLFSPSHDELPAEALADWILADQLPVRLQVQLHKYLWGDVRGK